MKTGNQDLLSEADFQRVVQDITPADRDLFDEFLHGMKHKTDDFSFLSSLDETCTSSSQPQQHDSTLRRQSSLSQPSSSMPGDRRAHHLPRGPNTIHYSPNSMPISTRPTSAAAAQTLKQMAVHHQQRIMYNYQQHSVPSYTSHPPAHSMRPYYQQSRSVLENDELSDPVRVPSTAYLTYGAGGSLLDRIQECMRTTLLLVSIEFGNDSHYLECLRCTVDGRHASPLRMRTFAGCSSFEIEPLSSI